MNRGQPLRQARTRHCNAVIAEACSRPIFDAKAVDQQEVHRTKARPAEDSVPLPPKQ